MTDTESESDDQNVTNYTAFTSVLDDPVVSSDSDSVSDSGSSSDFDDLQTVYDTLCIESFALKKSEVNFKVKLSESLKSCDELRIELEYANKCVTDLQLKKESLLQQIDLLEKDYSILVEAKSTLIVQNEHLEMELLAYYEKFNKLPVGTSKLNTMLNIGKEQGDRRDLGYVSQLVTTLWVKLCLLEKHLLLPKLRVRLLELPILEVHIWLL